MTINSLRPLRLVHRGTVLAAGFLFSAELLTEKEMRRRVLSLWQPGATVYRIDENLFLRFPAERQIDCRRAPGLPLVLNGNHFCGFPITPRDLKALEDLREAVIYLRAGKLVVCELHNAAIEIIENWFDISSVSVRETETLGEIKTKPVLPQEVSEETLKLREELKSVPAADGEMSEILQLLRRAREEQKAADKGASFVAERASDNSFWKDGFSFLKSIWSDFSQLFQTANDFATNSPAPKTTANAGYQSAQAEPDWTQKFFHKLRQLWVKTAFKLRFAQFFGHQQAEYLHKMMNLFERGDLNEALRYAIPLEDMQALAQMKNRLEPTPFLGFLRPRGELSIETRRVGAASSSVFLEDQWLEHLRNLYRVSFERLVAQGKIEEAAFVLAELLRDNHQAVAFLEKHGKLRLAAELAEARGLPKETVVRQWFIAGERERAVKIAILYNCFNYVVSQFEKEGKPEASELREMWAEALAAGGNYAAAVDVVWSLENKREKAESWIEKVIEQGGAPAARMLARKTSLFPQKFAEIKEQVLPLLEDESHSAAETRALFARELSRLASRKETSVLARATVRAILRDAGNNVFELTRREFEALAQISNNTALKTDLPPFPDKPSVSGDFKRRLDKNWKIDQHTFEFRVSANDQGANAVSDAFVLPDGKIALALGEAGIRILNRNGKQIAHFNEPAEKFIVADNAGRAISLIKRGEAWRLARVDFPARRAAHWCDAKISAFASNYNGNVWFVGVKDEFYAIDATAKDFESLWRVGETGEKVLSVARSSSVNKFLTFSSQGSFENWTYEHPRMYLRGRAQLKLPEIKDRQIVLYAANSAGAYTILISLIETEVPRFRVSIFDHERLIEEFELAPETIKCLEPQIVSSGFVLTQFQGDGAHVNFYEIEQGLIASIVLESAQKVSTRLDEKTLTITDDCGRFLVFDYENLAIRQNLRF